MNSILKKLDRIIFLLEELNRKMNNTGVRVPSARVVIARPVTVHSVRSRRIGIY